MKATFFVIGAALIILPENFLRWLGWFLIGLFAGDSLKKCYGMARKAITKNSH
ncbi:MAG: hypothetical protein QXP27_09695 [Candidatus Methanomethyliaceae archaeon]